MQHPSLSHALQQVAHAYRSHMVQTIRDANLPLPGTHVRILKAVCYVEACTARRIAQRMRRDKAQITRVLNDLLEAGLISKKPWILRVIPITIEKLRMEPKIIYLYNI